jgi:ion channel-forming bestrophin family protein
MKVKKLMLFYLIFTMIAIFVFDYFPNHWFIENIANLQIAWEALTVFGLAITFLIQFRNNNMYQRFHEGRQIWGEITNDTRNLSIMYLKAYSAVHSNFIQEHNLEMRTEKYIYNLISLVHSIRLRLLGVSNSGLKVPYHEYLDDAINASHHKPNAIMKELHKQVKFFREINLFDDTEYLVVHMRLNDLVNRYGSLSRILNNPLPKQYTILTL